MREREETKGEEKEYVEHSPRFSIESMSSPIPPTPGGCINIEEKEQDASIDKNAFELIRSCREERLSFEASVYSVPN